MVQVAGQGGAARIFTAALGKGSVIKVSVIKVSGVTSPSRLLVIAPWEQYHK